MTWTCLSFDLSSCPDSITGRPADLRQNTWCVYTNWCLHTSWFLRTTWFLHTTLFLCTTQFLYTTLVSAHYLLSAYYLVCAHHLVSAHYFGFCTAFDWEDSVYVCWISVYVPLTISILPCNHRYPASFLPCIIVISSTRQLIPNPLS